MRPKKRTPALPLPRIEPDPRDRPTRPVTPVALRRVSGVRALVERITEEEETESPSITPDPPHLDPADDPLIPTFRSLELRGSVGWEAPPIRALRERHGDDRVREAFRNWAQAEEDRHRRMGRRRALKILDGIPEGDIDGAPTGVWTVRETRS